MDAEVRRHSFLLKNPFLPQNIEISNIMPIFGIGIKNASE